MTPRVRGLGIDGRFPADVDEVVQTLLAPTVDSPGDHVTIVPDAHYPYHPSTGLVTHPRVVESVVAAVRDGWGVDDVAIAVPGSETTTGRRALALLGYAALADRLDVDAMALDEQPSTERSVSIDGADVSVRVPTAFQSGTVVVVPTLRRTPDDRLAGAGETYARAFVPGNPTAREIVASLSVGTPDVAVLDACHAYAGQPRAVGALFASADVRALDAVLAFVLGRSVRELPYLAGRAVPQVDGLDPSVVAARLPDSKPKASPNGSGLVARGFRAYARVTGDAVPPQFLEGDG